MVCGDEPSDKVSLFFRDATYRRLEDCDGGSKFVTEMPAPLERFAFGVSFTVMLPCPVRRFRNRCVGFAIGTQTVIEFDLRLKGFVRFAKIMPAGSDGQSGADYPGLLNNSV